jgi:hypothetical protein
MLSIRKGKISSYENIQMYNLHSNPLPNAFSRPKQKHENYLLPFLLKWVGDFQVFRTHLANDWLAGTWFFLWANVLLTIGSFFLLADALYNNNPKTIFLGCSSFFNSLLFMIGSLYYVSGSYPFEGQFYYENNTSEKKTGVRKRRATFSEASPSGEIVLNPMAPDTEEVIVEEGLRGVKVSPSTQKASTEPGLSSIKEGENEALTPKSSSDNLEDLVTKSLTNRQTVQPKATAWNPLHSPKAISKSSYSNIGGSPGGKAMKSKISAELGHDMDF